MAKLLNLFTTTIRRRIIFGFASIIALVVATAVGGYIQLSQVRQNAERIVPESLQIESLQTLALAVTSMDANLERFFIIGGVQFRDAILNDLSRLQEVVQSLKGNLAEDASPAVENEIVALETAVADLETEVVALVSADTTAVASREINQRILAIYSRIDTIKELQEDFSAQTLEGVKELTISQARIANNLSLQFAILGLATILIAVGATWFITRSIATPLAHLTETASRIAEGEMGLQIVAAGPSEVVSLARAFNSMTAQLRELISGLEARTRALETSTEVSRRLSTILDREQLVAEVVRQVQSAFNYYHAHIYLIDETTQDLVMAGGTGEAGRIMLSSGHRIEPGKGLTGRAATTNSVVLVPDVSQEEGWLPNPLLPDTRSEVAVPIAVGQRALGVLDVQHNVVNGLSATDADMLQSIANQIAIALQNADLFTEARQRAEHQAVVNLITQRIQSTTTVENALQVAIRELGRALGAQRASVQLEAGSGRDHLT